MRPLYFDDSYLQEFDAIVTSVDASECGVVLEPTAFYATGGGQLCDIGTLIANGIEYTVTEVKKIDPHSDLGYIHIVNKKGLTSGTKVLGKIDWQRRYLMMRMHSAAHVLSAAVHRLTGALVTGKQLGIEQSRIDFALENFDKENLVKYTEEANRMITTGALVHMSFMPREKALALPGMIRLMNKLPPDVAELRIVNMEGVDIQACGGTHVRNIKEIGKLKVLRVENKGSSNRRMYYTVV